jgi:hypothetical protein
MLCCHLLPHPLGISWGFRPPTPQEFPEGKKHEKDVKMRDSDGNVSPPILLQLLNY